jgi:signal transduction histidine kinase
VFTTVIENLLDNARSKRIREPNLEIFIRLEKQKELLQLTVTDTGSAISAEIYPHLLKEIVSSNDGFGIGLFQSRELALNHGYELTVRNNAEGKVCFSLQTTLNIDR